MLSADLNVDWSHVKHSASTRGTLDSSELGSSVLRGKLGLAKIPLPTLVMFCGESITPSLSGAFASFNTTGMEHRSRIEAHVQGLPLSWCQSQDELADVPTPVLSLLFPNAMLLSLTRQASYIWKYSWAPVFEANPFSFPHLWLPDLPFAYYSILHMAGTL